jgi:hypothetical protein
LEEKLTLLEEILENSNFPYKVDPIDLRKSPYMWKAVKKEGKRWL